MTPYLIECIALAHRSSSDGKAVYRPTIYKLIRRKKDGRLIWRKTGGIGYRTFVRWQIADNQARFEADRSSIFFLDLYRAWHGEDDPGERLVRHNSTVTSTQLNILAEHLRDDDEMIAILVADRIMQAV